MLLKQFAYFSDSVRSPSPLFFHTITPFLLVKILKKARKTQGAFWLITSFFGLAMITI
jgi:hypothetical protein